MVEWDKDREQAKVKSGYAALERESDAARERVWELMRRVATMVAQTPAGVIAKVAMAAALCTDRDS